MSENAIEIYGLTKRYGDLFAVRDLNLKIPHGSVYGLIGPNGAGKTTTLSVLASLLEPTAGRVLVGGFDPSRDAQGVRRKVGYMPDVMGLYENMRVNEYLQFFAAAYRIPAKEWPALIGGLLELVDLTDKGDAFVDGLSRGMKQRLSLARALAHDPEILLLDEPASGLDPHARIELRGLVQELASMGKTVVISSHILPELEEMCTEVAIMEAGALLASGPPKEIGVGTGQTRSVKVRLWGGSEKTFEVADEIEQRDLVRRLVVDEELPVIEVTTIEENLEDLFLRVTKGQRQ
ncbi:MAG: type transport system ATP-binding protein [Actinomycetota bacterium]|nr:type transport system ATP-binding protein [Actinomycetota bacterium]